MTSPGLVMTARAAKTSVTSGDRSRGRVLVIADDKTLFGDTLTLRDIEIVGVASGTAALVSLQRSRPHVVIADPSTRGLRVNELARMLAQSDDGIPLILAGSEKATRQNRLAALVGGAFDYFELPLEFELLIERVGQLVATGVVSEWLCKGKLKGGDVTVYRARCCSLISIT